MNQNLAHTNMVLKQGKGLVTSVTAETIIMVLVKRSNEHVPKAWIQCILVHCVLLEIEKKQWKFEVPTPYGSWDMTVPVVANREKQKRRKTQSKFDNVKWCK